MQVVSTLKVNINREKEARLKKILGLKKEAALLQLCVFECKVSGQVLSFRVSARRCETMEKAPATVSRVSTPCL